jgi:predicted nucleic acid-binding protein
MEQGREMKRAIPERLFVSIITIAELRLGVLNAKDDTVRARRLETLTRVVALDPLPINDDVATAWSEMRANKQTPGKFRTNDSWIAATAIAHGLPVVTQDNDYDDVPGLKVIKI